MGVTSNFYTKSLILRIKTILLASNWISLTVIILQKQRFSLKKIAYYSHFLSLY